MSLAVNYKMSGDKMLHSDIVCLMIGTSKNTLAERLRTARTQAGKTQKEMADIIGKDTTAYGHYERGRNEMDRETAVKICEALNIDLEWLMTGKGSAEPEPEVFSQLRDLKASDSEAFEYIAGLVKKMRENP